MPLGLSDLISESTSFPEAVILAPSPDALSLLAAGTIPPNPSELVGSKRMLAVLDELKRFADVILIDTPPCQQYADAFLLSQQADGVIYVLRSTRQEWGTHRRLLKQFEQTRAHVLGVVLNDVDVDQDRFDALYQSGVGPNHR
jgi:capsular exopolysaccharide synthesis family protein